MPTNAINTLRILSLEDSVRDFELIHELIVDAGYDPEMVRVENEPGFIDALTNQSFDIILADFNLPEYDAFTALQKTLEICPEVPFLVVSGAVGEETAIDLIKQGAVDYVLKDRPKRLISAITRALAEVREKQARQEAEKKLAEQNRLFRIAGETARFGGWRVDLDTNTCTWSDIVAEIHEMPSGYSPPLDEAIHFYAPEWRARITQAFRACAEQGIPYDEEMEIITRTRNRVWVRTIAEPVRDDKGEIIQVHGAFQDISERKQAAEKLAASEAELRALFANMNDVIIVMDREGRHLRFAPTKQSLYVQPADAMVGKTIDEILPQAQADYILKTIEQVLTTGDVITGEYSLKIDGEIVWLDFSASPLSETTIMWVARDFTKRKQAEDRLKESEARYRTLVDNVPGIVYLCQNDEHYTMHYLNEAVQELTGYPSSAFIEGQLSFVDLYHPEDVAHIFEDVDQAVEERQPFHLTYRLQHADGDYRWFEEWGTGVYEGDQLCYLEGFIADVSERKAIEETLVENEAYIKAVMDNLPIGVAVNSVDPAVIFSYMNDNFPRIYRTTREKLLQEDTFWEAVYQDPAFRAEIRERVMEDCASGEPERMHWEDIPITRPGEEITYISATNTPVPNQDLMISTVRNTTSRVRAEAGLRESEKRFRNALQDAPYPIMIHTEDGEVVFINQMWTEITGYTHQDIPNLEQWTEKAYGLEKDQVRELIAAQFKAAVQQHEVETKITTKAGSTRIWDLRSRPLGVLLDGRQAVITMATDITERVQHEQERLQRLSELEALEKITETLRHASTIEDAMSVLLEQALGALGLSAGGILLLDARGESLLVPTTAGWFDQISEEGHRPDAGINAQVFSSGKTYISEEFASDPLTNPMARDRVPPGWGGACVPILTLDETIGVIYVACQHPRQVQPEEAQLLESIAKIAGITLHRMSLLESALKRVKRLQAQQMIDKTIAGVYDLRMMLEIIVTQATTLLPAAAVSLLMYEPHSHSLTHAASSGFQTHQYPAARGKLGEGYAGQAALEHKTIHLSDLENSDPLFERIALVKEEKFLCYSVTPLMAKGQLKGVLEVFHRDDFKHDKEWTGYLESLASQTAVAIEDQENIDRLRRNAIELTQAYDKTIEGWSLALDLRDDETEGHSLRVAEITLKLAQKMGVSQADQIHIRRGALLHDMGKLGVPDSILLKPGKLSKEEWEIMKNHSRYAFDMLSPIAYLRPALDIPYYHHEKWDGSGYPTGLKGEQIPLAARIFAIVDVWDALNSDRPYRDAWPEEKIRNYIREQSGSHFDPAIVEAFFEVIEHEGH